MQHFGVRGVLLGNVFGNSLFNKKAQKAPTDEPEPAVFDRQLQDACMSGKVVRVNQLLRHSGVNLNQRDPVTGLPVIHAAAQGHGSSQARLTIVVSLLSRKDQPVDLSALDSKGRSAIDVALANAIDKRWNSSAGKHLRVQDLAVLQALFADGCKFQKMDAACAVLRAGVDAGDQCTVQRLLLVGLDTHVAELEYQTPEGVMSLLDIALLSCKPPVARRPTDELLLRAGLDERRARQSIAGLLVSAHQPLHLASLCTSPDMFASAVEALGAEKRESRRISWCSVLTAMREAGGEISSSYQPKHGALDAIRRGDLEAVLSMRSFGLDLLLIAQQFAESAHASPAERSAAHGVIVALQDVCLAESQKDVCIAGRCRTFAERSAAHGLVVALQDTYVAESALACDRGVSSGLGRRGTARYRYVGRCPSQNAA